MPLFGRGTREPVTAVQSAVPLSTDAPRIEVRSQQELAAAVADGAVPVLVAAEDFMIGTGVLAEARGRSRLHAVGDARVHAGGGATVTVGDQVSVVASDECTVRMYGAARAVLTDRSRARAYPATDEPFPDGSSQRTTGVDVELRDLSVLESWAPATVRAGDDSRALLHGSSYEMTAVATGRAWVSALGEVVVDAEEDVFVVAVSGRVTARGRVVVAGDSFPPDSHALPEIRASESTVVVCNPGADVEGPRVLSQDDVKDPEAWLALWGIEPQDGHVDLYVGVRPEDGMVMHHLWRRRAYLHAGDRVPEDLPVVARRNTWGMGPGGVEVRKVRVPVQAVRPEGTLDALYVAHAGEGVVVG
jgi:hypothetical protein